MDYMFEHLMPDPLRLVVEIGTYKGDWLGRLLKHVPGDYRVVCVDPWTFDADMGDVAWAWDKFHARFRWVIEGDKVFPIRSTSQEAADWFRGPIDVLHVDGNHREVEQDLRLWVPKVRRGGLIVGHDYDGCRHGWHVRAGVRAYGRVLHRVGWCWGKPKISCFYWHKTTELGEQEAGATEMDSVCNAFGKQDPGESVMR